MFTSIVVAIDGSSHAFRALAVGAELAARDDAELGIIYVVDGNISGLPSGLFDVANTTQIIDPGPNLFTNLEALQQEKYKSASDAAQESQRLVTQLAEHIIKDAEKNARIDGAKKITTLIANGNPVEEILIFAEKQKADAIVTGQRGMGPIQSFMLGSTSLKLAQAAPSTSIIVK